MSDHSQGVDRRELLRNALETVEALQARLDAIERSRSEPIAIVGLGCRFPGADGPDAFWRLLDDGVDAVREVPADRWGDGAYAEIDPEAAAKMPRQYGGFLDRIDQFDTHFFGIAPREAMWMDPQHRLVLEVCWEALEDAGVAPESLRGSLTGVFVGITGSEYATHATVEARSRLDIHLVSGAAPNAAAGRVSYLLGLNGPSMAVDTACSSSLTAVHLACQSLRSGECDLALAGGVNALVRPDHFVTFFKWGMLAPDGHCKTFDAAADGLVRGEGCGFVVLRRLSDALGSGDRILALIRGSAVNQDGASGGLTVPNGLAQQAVIRRALEAARVRPADVDYVEAHGTGTSLGDPIELEALDVVIGEDGPKGRSLIVGSVKTNVGHLEAAAGMAGLMKVVLALEHARIPRHLHFRSLNPRTSLRRLNLVVPVDAVPWPRGERPRIAGVSGFGFSGTNVHVVVEEPPAIDARPAWLERPVHIVTLSAKSDERLRVLAARWRARLDEAGDLPLGDVAFTANAGRSHFPHRAALVAESPEVLQLQLAELAEGRTPDGAIIGHGDPGTSPRIAFLFTGQGAQYAGMGRRLFEAQPVFRAALEQCDRLLRSRLEPSLLEVIYGAGGESLLDQTAYTQPALFAVEYALAELWKSWGIEPSCVLGHSLGEYVAACVAGAIGLEDALQLVAERGRLMQELPAGGEMVALWASEARVRAELAMHDGEASLAAVNGPDQVVVSGTRRAIRSIAQRLQAAGVRVQALAVSHAFHSPLMDPILDHLEHAAAAVAHRAPRIGLVSNVTGELLSGDDALSPAYWRRHTRDTVRFSNGVKALHREGCTVFLEIGPSPALLRVAERCLPQSAAVWLSTLRRGRDDWNEVLGSLATLYAHGVPVDWRGFDRGYHRRKIALPTSPFRRERCWIPSDRPQRDREVDPAEWLYELQWQEKARATGLRSPAGTPRRGPWIVLEDRGGVGRALATALAALGERAVRVAPGKGFHAAADGSFLVHPERDDDFDALLDDLRAHGDAPRGIVHLWSLDAAPSAETTIVSLETDQRLGVGSVLRLVRASARGTARGAPRLVLVTRGAQPAGQGALHSVAQAPLWGLGRVIALELPELSGGLIDLDPDAPVNQVADLARELVDPDGEDQVAYRNGTRYVVRLVNSRSRRSQPVHLRPDATYLVTGGLGGLGLEVAEWMAERGARRIVLTGRTGLPDRASWDALPPPDGLAGRRIEAVRRIEARGVSVDIETADSGDPDQMSALFERLRRSSAPLRGVVHAAGLLRLNDVAAIRDEDLASVFRPKLAGGWILHELTKDLNLDFFALFSSGASAWGSKRLGHYAAANHFLDALAHHRRALGLPALSINWGPWGGRGMTTAEAERGLAQMGVRALSPGEGLAALEHLLGTSAIQAIAAKVDWRSFKPIYAARAQRPLFEQVGEAAPLVPRAQGRLAGELAAATPGERRDLLVRRLAEQVGSVLGVEPDRLDPRAGFTDLGMDSVMAVELRSRLEEALGRPLPSTLAFDFPTIELLGDYLLRDVLSLAGVKEKSPGQEAASDLAQVSALSDEEAREQLAGELQSLAPSAWGEQEI